MTRIVPLAVLLGALPAAAAPRAYLPAIGPAPIRVHAPAASAHRAILPPLDLGEPPPPGELAEPAPAATQSPDTTARRTAQAILDSPVSAQPSQPPPPPPPALATPDDSAAYDSEIDAEPETITPQMLLQFFQKPGGRNRPETSVIAPLNFTPPATTPSSTATYNGSP